MRVYMHFFAVIGAAFLLIVPVHADDPSFIGRLQSIDSVASTIPTNGDVNPYGVAIVPVTTGALVENSVLVSNFNNSANLQGTGTTIDEIDPNGGLTVFATIDAQYLPGPCPGGVGLTTALVALRSGWVIVGSLPTADGTAATAQAGCLIVLNSNGHPVATLSGNGTNDPWDMTALDLGTGAVLFVTNVLNGTVAANGATVANGSILRVVLRTPSAGIPVELARETIASAFPERTDPAALVIGPTGLGLGEDGRLFVADTLQDRIAVIPNALTRMDDAGAGTTVAQGGALKQPLGLVVAPNGDIITVNGGVALMVETNLAGRHSGVRFVDVSHSRNGAGTLFGLAVAPDARGVYFVDDGNNTLNILH